MPCQRSTGEFAIFANGLLLRGKTRKRRKDSGATFSRRGPDVGQLPIEGLSVGMSLEFMSKVSMNPFVPLNSKAFGPSR